MRVRNAARSLAPALLALTLGGCAGPETEIAWLEGFTYGWAAFNHRMSYVQATLEGGAPMVSVVGGNSTTGVPADLDDGCDPDACQEFPFIDSAVVELRMAQATVAARKVGIGVGQADLVVGPAGGSVQLELPVEGYNAGESSALITGVVWDSDTPLPGGEACYRPEYGWHPREIYVEVSPPVLSAGTATVEVTGRFAAGLSLEEVRACVDAVAEEAELRMRVDVLVVVADGLHSETAVAHEQSWPWDGEGDPVEQLLPELEERPYELLSDPGQTAVGFGSLSFSFHQEEQGRGAYLRTLGFAIDPVQGWASGHATNYSPGTQLSGFDYRFEGLVRSVELEVDVQRELWVAELPVELDAQGRPVVHDLSTLDEI